MIDKVRSVTVRVLDDFSCALDCAYLRRYDSTGKGQYWCVLESEKLTLIDGKIHRTSHCDGCYLFTLVSEEGKPPKFERD